MNGRTVTGMAEYDEFYWCSTCANYFPNDCCDCCDGTDANHECYEKKPMPTNADRIRAMSDEELAWFYAVKISSCYGCESSTTEDCAKCWLDWLQQEATE